MFLDVMEMSIQWIEKRTDIWIACRFVDTTDANHTDFLHTQCLLKGIKGVVYRGIQETLCTSHNTISSMY